MRKKNNRDLIQHRLHRAREAFEEALIMQRECHWNACANRLYYSCFYAVTALLAREGLSSNKHSGIKALFNQRFVKTGEVSKEHGKLYSQLFEERQEGDYVDFVIFEKDAVLPWVPRVKEFIESISRLALEADND